MKLAIVDHEEVTYAPAIASESRVDMNGINGNTDNNVIDDDDDEFADLRLRRSQKRVAQVSRISRELTKRKRRQEDCMEDSE